MKQQGEQAIPPKKKTSEDSHQELCLPVKDGAKELPCTDAVAVGLANFFRLFTLRISDQW